MALDIARMIEHQTMRSSTQESSARSTISREMRFKSKRNISIAHANAAVSNLHPTATIPNATPET